LGGRMLSKNNFLKVYRKILAYRNLEKKFFLLVNLNIKKNNIKKFRE
jgi:hypothetical protein